MQEPQRWLSDPLCTAVRINHSYFCCKAFYRYREGRGDVKLLLLLLLLLALDSPFRKKKVGIVTGYFSFRGERTEGVKGSVKRKQELFSDID